MSQQDAGHTTEARLPGPVRSDAAARGRRFDRRSLESPLSIEVETTTVKGMADNLSRVGLMLYTDEPLRVTVRIDGYEGGRPLKGRLVRLQRMDDSMTGVAIEFDDLVDPDSVD